MHWNWIEITYTVYVQTDKLQMMGRNTFWQFTTGTLGSPGLLKLAF
jgi:hypothetical protein